MYSLEVYLTLDGRNLFKEWFDSLRDEKAKKAIYRRLNRIEAGNFGDSKHVREGVCELRLDIGPGYRVYYAQVGKTIVLLLCGGTKKGQVSDIDRACQCFEDWKSRK